MHRLPVILWLTLGAGLVGCREGKPQPSLSDDRFIEVMVALRQQAATTTGDSAAYVNARDRVLAEHDVSFDQLQEYVDLRSADLARYASVWETINERLAPAELH